MTAAPAAFDHLVVAADTLEQGTEYIRKKLGAAPAGGGRHLGMGTHNRVLRLGRGRYLEVIAVDPEAPDPDFPRWLGLDDPRQRSRLRDRPRLVTWVARTRDLDGLAQRVYGQPARGRPMRRGNLRWRFAFTRDGSLPGAGLIPHLIQWQVPTHPAESMMESGCSLLGLEGAHPHPQRLKPALALLGLDPIMTLFPVSAKHPAGLRARLQTPRGVVVLE